MHTSEKTFGGVEGLIILTTKDGNKKTLDATNIKATYSVEKSGQRFIGSRYEVSKPTGSKGSGSLTVNYGETVFIEMMEEYQATGRLPKFEIMIENNDEASEYPTRRMMLYDCTIDEVDIALLDESEPFLKIDVPFTFERFARI